MKTIGGWIKLVYVCACVCRYGKAGAALDLGTVPPDADIEYEVKVRINTKSNPKTRTLRALNNWGPKPFKPLGP